MICDADCYILSVNPKFGGATHDAFIWDNSIINNYMRSFHRNNETLWLLGDSGYPQRPWMMTPYRDTEPHSVEESFNKKHSTARVVIENTFGRLKNRWRCVCKDRVLHCKPSKCARIIVACCVLHNFALRHNIPDPEDHTTETTFTETMEIIDRVDENEPSNELLMGSALRDQLARRIVG